MTTHVPIELSLDYGHCKAYLANVNIVLDNEDYASLRTQYVNSHRWFFRNHTALKSQLYFEGTILPMKKTKYGVDNKHLTSTGRIALQRHRRFDYMPVQKYTAPKWIYQYFEDLSCIYPNVINDELIEMNAEVEEVSKKEILKYFPSFRWVTRCYRVKREQRKKYELVTDYYYLYYVGKHKKGVCNPDEGVVGHLSITHLNT